MANNNKKFNIKLDFIVGPATRNAQRFASALSGLSSKFSEANRKAKEAKKSSEQFGSALSGRVAGGARMAAGALATLAGAAGIAAVGESAVKAASQSARLEAALRNQGMSAAAAKEKVKEIRKQATELGYSLEETGEAYSTLTGSGADTKTIDELWLRSQDLASSFGMTKEKAKSFFDQISELPTENNRIIGEGDLEMFKQYGISVLAIQKEFASNKGITIDALTKGLKEGKFVVGDLINAMNDLAYSKSLEKGGKALAGVPGALAKEIARTDPEKLISNIKEKFDKFYDSDFIKSKLVSGLDKLDQTLKNVFQWFEDNEKLIDESIGVISGAFSELFSVFTGDGENSVKIGENLTKGLKWIVDNKDDVKTGIQAIVVGLVAYKAVALASAAWNAVATLGFAGTAAAIWAAAAPILIIGALIGGLYLIFKNWDAISQGFIDGWNWLVDGLDSIWESIKSGFSSLWDSITNGISKAWKWIKDTFNTAMDWLGELPDKFLNFGSDIIDGLLKGITNGADLVIGKVKDIGKGAISAFKSVLGIASPSKVFAEFGEDTAIGYEKGLSKYNNSVSMKSGELANASIDGYSTSNQVVNKNSTVNNSSSTSSPTFNVTFNVNGSLDQTVIPDIRQMFAEMLLEVAPSI